MNTLIFLAGCGAGALASTLMIMTVFRSAVQSTVKQREKNEAYNVETVALMRERNELERILNQVTCEHRRVTVTDGGGRCDRCKADVEFVKETGNWR